MSPCTLVLKSDLIISNNESLSIITFTFSYLLTESFLCKSFEFFNSFFVIRNISSSIFLEVILYFFDKEVL